MIIAFSGKKQSGKDTAGLITQTLLSFPKADNETVLKYLKAPLDNPEWKIKKFATYLKQIVANLTNCYIEDLESEEKKNEVVYIKYRFENKYLEYIQDFEDIDEGLEIFNKSVETYVNSGYDTRDAISKNVTYEEIGITRRNVLERIGTDVARTIHSNIWIDHLFSDYRNFTFTKDDSKWLITDTRFPNEAEAVKNRGGLVIRINRKWFKQETELGTITLERGMLTEHDEEFLGKEHISETALDNYQDFDYIINNDGSIEDLINKIRTILITIKLINV